MSRKLIPHPFIKWAGGKTRMLSHIMNVTPSTFGSYYEPFLGGGAVYFDLVRQGRVKEAFLGDWNPELVNAYQTVKRDVNGLIEELVSGEYVYDRKIYLSIRALNPESMTPVQRAARFIYLNHTCFNGLYRVNKKGKFNVPFGRYKDPVICDSPNLKAVSAALVQASVSRCNFATLVQEAKAGDFVYFDPPYYPVSETAKFTNYTDDVFGPEQQAALAKTFAELIGRGVTAVLSNSYCDETLELYKDFKIIELVGSRNVGGPADYRKSVKEIMVVAADSVVNLNSENC